MKRSPPLFDLQVNGFAGVDFQQDELSEADLVKAARKMRAAGCGGFLLTLITDRWPRLLARLSHLKRLREQNEELCGAIRGWHIEGPFLSRQPGFHGAHNPAWMLDPTPDRIRELRAAAGNDPLLLTLAPELPGAIPAIRLATRLNMQVSLGHTDASAKTLQAAVEAGAALFTHLGNGCPRELDRYDNILWRVLETSGLKVSLIPDGIHVSPPLFRLIHRVLDHASIIYVTDAMAAAGARPGPYTLGSLKVQVGRDRVVRQPGSSLLAGSALTPEQAILRAAEMLELTPEAVRPRMSRQPMEMMGLAAGEAG